MAKKIKKKPTKKKPIKKKQIKKKPIKMITDGPPIFENDEPMCVDNFPFRLDLGPSAPLGPQTPMSGLDRSFTKFRRIMILQLPADSDLSPARVADLDPNKPLKIEMQTDDNPPASATLVFTRASGSINMRFSDGRNFVQGDFD